ncbi:hypothetical protein [Asticcacaulis taihuensis]|uniref:Uncharacterized protein n=1 Tax=Asticcacaulis taihuensis TaxID=260084 RepID=A0A1G4SDE8_9CAUL|nr:hypothetical protein [Asticcacaulis taihuensis]SCW67190.1 hypothetical protein SAMN02927928_2589 [Asticcacaulis taihuensis]
MTQTLLWTRSLRYGPAGAALAIALLGAVAALQFAMPDTMPVILPFSESFYARTLAATDNDLRIDLANKTVNAAPGRAENWLLLASAYQQKDAALSGRVLDALRRSYAAGPLSPDAHDWRLAYVFSNWSLMPDDLRRAAMAEAEAYATRYAGFVYIKELAPTLPDSEGRMALGLVALTHDRAMDSARRVAQHRAMREITLQ